jgi:tRNA-dihydrouridine synthase 4
MILAEEFSRSQQARVADFTTSANERGVFWMEPKARRGVNYVPGMKKGTIGEDETKEDVRERTVAEEDDDLAQCTGALAVDDNVAPETMYPSKTYYTPRPHTRLPPTLVPPTPRSRLVRGALIAQMASPNGPSLADAAELVSPHVDGLDINCGCPQRWAYNEGIGCALLRKPEVVADMVRCTHDRLGWDWPVSVKIRVDDAAATQTLVDNAIAMGVSHITIHGRTRHQASTEPVCLDSITRAVDMVRGRVPTVANGDLWDLEDARNMYDTGVDGVMAARGLLAK